MTIEKVVVGALDTNCYILRSDNIGVIVDPGDEPERILNELRDVDVQIILATHRHHDHISALREVKEALGKEAGIHHLDWVDGFDEKLQDKQVIVFGDEKLEVIHTPGHTPGSICLRVGGVLFSGDTLFPGGPGNTSYAGGDEEAIMRSIRERLMTLPDETPVYPGHGAATTIGKERVLY